MPWSAAIHHPTPPRDVPPARPPTPGGLWSEWRTPLQVARLGACTPRLAFAPRGDRGPVVLAPGWRAPEASMAPLRGYLRLLGHDARYWGLGTNEGHPGRDSRLLARRVEELAANSGRRVALVGWSLGGVVARETARARPELVSRVITFGTPAVGGPTHTVGAHSWGDDRVARMAALTARQDRHNPIRVPITAVFTKHDHVVWWQACIDHISPDVDHVEVGSTHFSMGIDPDVWLVIARALAKDRLDRD